MRDAVRYRNETLIAGFEPETGDTVELHSAIAEGAEAAIEYSVKGVTRGGEICRNA